MIRLKSAQCNDFRLATKLTQFFTGICFTIVANSGVGLKDIFAFPITSLHQLTHRLYCVISHNLALLINFPKHLPVIPSTRSPFYFKISRPNRQDLAQR